MPKKTKTAPTPDARAARAALDAVLNADKSTKNGPLTFDESKRFGTHKARAYGEK